MKPRIFIGSSTESQVVAKRAKAFFQSEYVCDCWYDDHFFEQNESTYDNLLKKAAAYEYAIFIGGMDDKVARVGKNEEESFKVRDNVCLEFGLYAGIITKERTFFLLHKSVTVASDLKGITLNFYEDDKEMKECCQHIKEKIEKEEKISRISLLPSTSLAIGYYRNFVEPVGEQLFRLGEINVDGEKYTVKEYSKCFEVVIPESVSEDWKTWAQAFYDENDYKEVNIGHTVRELKVKLDYKALKEREEVRIFDVPQTLRAGFEAVDMVTSKNYAGETDWEIGIKKKEVNNFVKTLRNLIQGNTMVKKVTEIKYYQ